MEIEIRNWDKYNPKRDQKTYSWLRLNNDLFSGQDFSEFTPMDILIWVCLLCEASKKNSPNINLKAGYIQRVTKLTLVEICESIAKLHNDNFLEIKGAVAPLPSAVVLRHFATPDTTPTYERTYERTNILSVGSTEIVEDLKTDYTHPLDLQAESPKPPCAEQKANDIAEAWNVIAEDHGLPKVKLPLSKDRIKLVKPAIAEFSRFEDWVLILGQVPMNRFNLGENDRGWKANFDWLFHKTKFNYRKLWESANASQNS